MFLGIGALLIVAFTLLYSKDPESADALLFSPIPSSQKTQEQKKKDYGYKLVFADSKKVIYKEIQNDTQTLKIVKTGTNISEDIVTGARIGFSGFITDNELIFVEDKEGLSRFTVSKYHTEDKTITPILAFNTLKDLPLSELDSLISISPSKNQLAINHESGIVIYTIKTEAEKTILENSQEVSYLQPKWITDSLLLVYQSMLTTQTPMIVTATGTIQSVFPSNLKDLSVSQKGLPLTGVSNEGLHIVEPKKTTLVLKTDENTIYNQPVWSDDSIFVLSKVENLATVIKTDKLGKKVIAVKEFLTEVILSNLQTDPSFENIYFLGTTKTDSSITVTFYKMEKEDSAPESFYSISKNL